MKIFNLKDRKEYCKEVAILEHKEWGSKDKSEAEFIKKIDNKVQEMLNNFDKDNYCKLVLLDNEILIGFISIFPEDGNERKDLTPWYATMYVKEEYRGKGYSRLLNTAILKEAKNRGYEKLYLKTNLVNYYEKFGAVCMGKLNNGEKLYYINID